MPCSQTCKSSFILIKKILPPSRSPKCNSPLQRSGSVPILSEKARITSPLLKPLGSPHNRRMSRHHHNNHHHNHRHHGSMVQRTSSYLHPRGLLRYHRHAISVDETGPLRHLNDSTHGSQCSVTFDPTPEIIDIAPVHKKRPPKRSDTARKHMLARQRQIEKEEQLQQQQHSQENERRRRRSSTMSDNSVLSQKAELRRASTASRTNSIDSRCTKNASSVNDLYVGSLEKHESPINAISDLSIAR